MDHSWRVRSQLKSWGSKPGERWWWHEGRSWRGLGKEWIDFKITQKVKSRQEPELSFIQPLLRTLRKQIYNKIESILLFCDELLVWRTKPSLHDCSQPLLGFPGGSDGKESACNAGDLGLIPWSRSFPGGGNGKPLQYSCLGNPMDKGACWANSSWGHRVRHNWIEELDTIEWLTPSLISLWGFSSLFLRGYSLGTWHFAGKNEGLKVSITFSKVILLGAATVLWPSCRKWMEWKVHCLLFGGPSLRGRWKKVTRKMQHSFLQFWLWDQGSICYLIATICSLIFALLPSVLLLY